MSKRSVTNLSDRKIIRSEKEMMTRNDDVNENNNCAFVVFYFENVARHDSEDMLTLFYERIRINAKVNSSTAATGTYYRGLSFR